MLLRRLKIGLALAVGWSAVLLPMAQPAAAATGPKLTVAAYFGWWGTPAGPTGAWSHWYSPNGRLLIKDHPASLYDSEAAKVVSLQLSAAAASGVNAFAFSWWGQGSPEDHNLGLMLNTTASVGSPVRVAAEFETAGLAAGGATGVAEQLGYLLSTYAAHPAYLHYEGRPVVFLYNPAALTANYSTWAQIIHSSVVAPYNAFFVVDSFDSAAASVFDAIFSFEVFGPNLPYDRSALATKYANARLLATQQGKTFVATAEPGFNDSAVRPMTLDVERNGTQTYDDVWSTALASRPDWMFIDSWNEWHEATEIETSNEYGTTFLDDTASWVTQFNATT